MRAGWESVLVAEDEGNNDHILQPAGHYLPIRYEGIPCKSHKALAAKMQSQLSAKTSMSKPGVSSLVTTASTGHLCIVQTYAFTQRSRNKVTGNTGIIYITLYK